MTDTLILTSISPFAPIRPLFQARIHVLEQDVRKSTADDPNPAVSAGFDMVCALNYSYSIFKERSDLVAYVTID